MGKVFLRSLRFFFIILFALSLFYSQAYGNGQYDRSEEAERLSRVTIRGGSLSPLLVPGQDVDVLYGYYAAHNVARNDIVLIRLPGRESKLIKIVRGLPRDRFSIQKVEGSGQWHLLINQEPLRNSEGKTYLIPKKRQILLESLRREFNGVIPEDSYFVAGNLSAGSSDSTRFGFVKKASLVAKVLYP